MNHRCGWVTEDPLYIEYHDQEWGVPVFDDRKLFEFLILESFQAGLSWLTILKKRRNFTKSFSHFNPKKVAQYSKKQFDELMANAGIIRNRLKIEAAINNSRQFLNIQEEFGSFSNYSWEFVDKQPIQNRWKNLKQVPATTKESDAFSMDLKKRGFKFMGSTVVYAHMQAVGMVNDHTINCFRYKEVTKISRKNQQK
ncbi:MAG TPA: DNA-3-methyladenine glycosylase I [Nitrospiria bacterium]|jgi:DNA-3-methyladenine glycosylase I